MFRACLRDGCREPLSDTLVCPQGHRAESYGWLVLSDEEQLVAIVTFKADPRHGALDYIERIDWAPGWGDDETERVAGRDSQGQAPRRYASNGRELRANSYAPERRVEEIDVIEHGLPPTWAGRHIFRGLAS